MTETTELQVILVLVVVIGICRLPGRRKLAGILAGVFLLLLPFLPLDAVDEWIAGPLTRAVGLLTVIVVALVFFTSRPHCKPDS